MWYTFRTSVYLTCILNRVLHMVWLVLQFQNISISHTYIETEYCTRSDMWYSFRTSVYLTCILKQNIVHGVTCDTVTEHLYILYVYWNRILYMEWHVTVSEHLIISHTYWNRILYMEWHVIRFQNISISHMYSGSKYFTSSDMSYSFRTSVYLTCILKQNIVHELTCGTVSEHPYISHVYWSRILYMEWHVIQLYMYTKIGSHNSTPTTILHRHCHVI